VCRGIASIHVNGDRHHTSLLPLATENEQLEVTVILGEEA